MVRWLSRIPSRFASTSDRSRKIGRRRLWLSPLEDRAVPATFTVNSTSDSGTGAGNFGDLRYCIAQANATVGTDLINFDGGVFTSGTTILIGSELSVTDSVNINSVSADNVIIDAQLLSRVFKIDNTSTQITVALKGLTMQNGKALTALRGAASTDGGGVGITDEIVTIENCVISGCQAEEGGGVSVNIDFGSVTILNSTIKLNTATANGADGGGVNVEANSTSLTIKSSTITGNVASGEGAGVYITGITSLLVENSTIDTNTSAAAGGGVFWTGAVGSGGATIRQSTLANNKSTGGSGGGVFVSNFAGTMNFQNSTVTGNQCGPVSVGGGIGMLSGRGGFNLQSTIVSGNTNGSIPSDIFSSFSVTAANSAIGNPVGFKLTDLGGNLPLGADLFLGSLQNNGGQTNTCLPGAGSPLRNAGSNPSGLTTDQTGAGRVQGSAIDIGAVESIDSTDTPVATAQLPTITAAQVGTSTFQVKVTYVASGGGNNIDASTIDLSDITIEGPGYLGQVNPISGVPGGPSASTLVATYTFNAPDNNVIGQWDASDNSYTSPFIVRMNFGAVSDTNGTTPDVTPGSIGQFRSSIGQKYTVNTDTDFGIGAGTVGDLRYCIDQANFSTNSSDTITFDPAFFSTPRTIVLNGSELNVNDTLTVVGPGKGLLTIDANKLSRIFDVDVSAGPSFALTLIPLSFSLSDMRLINGFTNDSGGAIQTIDDPITLTNVSVENSACLNPGTTGRGDGGGLAVLRGNTVTITNCSFTGNSAGGAFADGGGIVVVGSGDVTITDTIVSGNQAFFSGGGVYLRNAKATILNTTISGNIAAGATQNYSGGAGLYLNGGTIDVLVRNATISGNLANFNGGGVLFRSSSAFNVLTIQNSTITDNRSVLPTSITPGSGGGGIAMTVIGSTINLESTVVSGNFGNTFTDFAITGTVVAKNSAIGSKLGIPILTDMGGNQFASVVNLGAVADNGGARSTNLTGAGSKLIDAGSNPGGLTTDARGAGFPRLVGAQVDIGAVESTGTNPVALVGQFADVTSAGGTTYKLSVTYLDDTGMLTSTFDDSDLIVTGPNGFSATLKRGTITPNTGAASETVEYSFTPPGGSWDGNDVGFYTVSLKSGQVTDAGGKAVGGGPLGFIRVSGLAKVITVKNNNDSGPDSFRQAVLDANLSPGQDTITFDPLVFTNGSPAINVSTSGRVQISDDLVIQGLGANKVALDGGGLSRILYIHNGVTGSHISVDVSGVTFQNASVTAAVDGTARGGAILVTDEFVSFTDCVFNANKANLGGGAIAMNGSAGKFSATRTSFINNESLTAETFTGGAIRLTTTVNATITDCTFDGNKSQFNSGGAIAVLGAGLLLQNSTFVNNETGLNAAATGSAFGGAIVFGAAPTQFGWTIRNSTFTGNKSRGRGGAIMFNGLVISGGQAGGVLTIQNSTITGNNSNAYATGTQGGAGGGISSQYGGVIMQIESSIVSGNIFGNTTPAASDIATVAAGQVFLRNSALGSTNNLATGTLIDLGGNLPVGAALNLGSLQNNGGLTQTIAPNAGSPVIDAGSNPTGASKDQNGGNRVVGTRTDIGAFEVTTVADLPTAEIALPANVTVGGATTFDVVVTYTDTTGIKAGTIGLDNITVKGGVFVGDQTPTSFKTTGSGSLITATYTFAAPSGAFANATNGVYTATLKGSKVEDSTGNFITAVDQDFGTFRSLVGKSFVVDTNADAGLGSLRQAVIDANASLGVDTIMFDAAKFPSMFSTVVLTAGEIVINDGLVIQGLNANDTKVQQTTVGARVFRVMGAGQFNVQFDKLTILGGNATSAAAGNAPGGGILSFDENVTVSNSVITGNAAGSGTLGNNGGGISVQEGGNLTIINSTISNNTTTAFGGGIGVNRNTSSVVVQNSTVSGNTATGTGGGIYINYGGSLIVTDSTINGNNASGANGGGGIGFGNLISGAGFLVRNSTISGNGAIGSTSNGGGVVFTSSLQGKAIFQNNTITLNTAANTSTSQGNGGGGITWRLSVAGSASNFATLQLDSNIIAQNGGATGFPDISTPHVVVATKNLIGAGDVGFSLTNADNLLGTKASPLDAKLDVLANNGGTTFTHALKAGSPAIDAGFNPAGLTLDQRGATRTQGKATDIGSFESTPTATPAKLVSVSVNGGGVQRSMVTSLVLTFDSAVSFVGAASAAFTLQNQLTTNFATLNAVLDGTGTIATITFTGGSVNLAGSLSDGRYTLTILANQFAGTGFDGNNDGIAGDNFVEVGTPTTGSKLFRFFGDSDGNGQVNTVDFNAFRSAFGGSSVPFDFDGVGGVTTLDFNQFRSRFGGSI